MLAPKLPLARKEDTKGPIQDHQLYILDQVLESGQIIKPMFVSSKKSIGNMSRDQKLSPSQEQS